MRCLGCDFVIRIRSNRCFTWTEFQLCPSCFNELVPEYYPLSVKNRLKK